MSVTITILESSSLVPTPEIGRFDLIRVDFAPEATVTEHPVELGGEVSDHVQVRPLRFTAEVFVTASPLGIPSPFAIDDAIGFFERALGKPTTVVIDGEGTFSPMVLEAFPHGRTNVAGRSFALRFKHVRIANSLSVTIPPRMPAPVAAVGAPSEASLGQQAPTPGTPTSVLRQTGDSIVGFARAAAGLAP